MENNYIVTTPSDNDTLGLDTLSWNEIYAANFAFDKPFCLRLSDNQLFFSEQVVRIIPKRRMVAFGVWQGKQVVAKLFFDARHAKRQMEKDVAGIKALQKNKIPTPELYYEGVTPDRRIHMLIFERITDAVNLEDVWRGKKNVSDVLPQLKSVIIEIATQHVLGLLQYDLHLKNFLLTEKTVYTLDGGQIEVFPNLLSKKVSMNNLALFLSQLGIDTEGYQEILFRHYAEARGWSLKQDDFIELFLLIKKWNDLRWKKYARKIFRNSSNFASIKKWSLSGMYDRQYAGPEFNRFLECPDAVFKNSSVKYLKRGRSSTVIKIRMDNRDYVIKRYNMKNFWHRLCRCMRMTRAASSWRFAQKLNLFDILTARPAAFIENRILGFRGTSYYVTEYVSSEHADDYFIRHFSRQDKCLEMIKQIGLLLKSIARLEITHGDLKITNILVNAENQPVLIDLDGAREHLSMPGLRKAWRNEIDRFLANFSSNPALRKKFEAELGKW